ncbi:MAG: geranylgeranyl pyrophosphate synthase [Microbacterium sp. SCN 70-27]|uniref:polyprenyl synthetase family protein n=1 Tax=unclassified Microbacterium TaxID=2609290 RepID=UPI000868CFF1|nr:MULTISPECIES: polyprenyl synthetase family protein [unclassified Microbacterium]MBN9224763.1 polyprenyl synthetase family protein [Microbacterium sp.]ODT28175.1 MAG: geranylgeranyl pyrophosphate synthase [Microbacterium sp. SCN 70-27]
MIALDDTDQRGVDGAIDAALERLVRRGGALGGGSTHLTQAAASAASGGKRLRPRLVVASYRSFSAPAHAAVSDEDAWQVAAAFELLHAAFVVHDDIIDGDVERRGVPNVAGRFQDRARRHDATPDDTAAVGRAAGLLAGDLLLFEATRLVASIGADARVRTELIDVLDEAILVSAAGELADVENAAYRVVPDTDALLRAAHDKTSAYSFEAPLVAGAILAGAPRGAQRALADAAADLGLAFQLVDDLIGTFGTRVQAGRAPGADLRQAKRTPLIGIARDTDAWPEVRTALALAHTGPVAVRRAQRVLEASGARHDVVALVGDALQRARANASHPKLPAPTVSLLARIADAVESRVP